MSNLLDKASIILTPTAYNNGEALCVKPSDGSGDFDFSRNSAATRVNAQGLVENVQILSSNLVQNGDFSEEGAEEVSNGSFTNGSTDWTLGGEVTIGDNLAHFESNTNTYSYIRQDISSLTSKTYKIQLEVKNYVSGAVQVAFSGASPITQNLNVSTDGVYTAYLTPNANGDDFEVSREFNGGNFNFDITNISVKEVGQNWALVNATIGNDLVLLNADSANAQITQSNLGSTNSTAKLITFTTLSSSDEVSQILRISQNIAGSGVNIYTDDNGVNLSAIGVHKVTIPKDTSANDILFVRLNSGANRVVSLSNFSVIEITTDTSLPRINYEGFSYQDALGSELVTNGSFDVNGNWTNFGTPLVSEQSSTRYYTAPFSWYVNGDAFRQGIFSPNNFTLTNGKTYNVSLWVYALDGAEILSGISNTDKSVFTSHAVTQNEWTNITYSAIANATSASYISILTSSSTLEFYVDNVSVKEYLGQEVVPDSGCGSWLWESQSTNLITQSETFSDSYWIKRGLLSVLDNNVTSPNGNLNGSLLIEDTSTNFHWVQNSATITSSSTVTISVFAKAKDTRNLYIRSYDSAVDIKVSQFNISNGTIISTDLGSTSKIEDYGNGWYRCSQTRADGSGGGSINYNIGILNGTSINYTGDGTSGIYIWGAMLEQGNISSYIPTSGSQVTRNQDLCTNGGSLASINSTEGVLYAEIAALANDGTSRRITLLESLYDKVSLVLSPTSNSIQGLVLSGGSVQFNQTFSISNTLDFNKIAFKYKTNDFAIWVNGVEVATDTSGNTPIGLSELSFADGDNTSNKFFGKTKAVAVWKEALTDAELTELTTI